MLDDFSLPASKVNILVVEDEPSTRDALIRALRLIGYRAAGAKSGSDALEKLALDTYQLMLLDLRLPGLDGVAVMEQIKQDYPDLLVIVLTAHGTLESAITAIRAGAVDYLLKPCKINDIESAIARAVQSFRADMRRQHLLDVMQSALEALCEEENWEEGGQTDYSGRFMKYGPIRLDREKRLVIVSGGNGGRNLQAELTDNEMAIMAYLIERPDIAWSCQDLVRFALNYDATEIEARGIIRPHISRLRRKIELDPTRPKLIRTVRGKGYLLATDGLSKRRKGRR